MPTFTLPAPQPINGDLLEAELSGALGVERADLVVTYAAHDPAAPTVEIAAPDGATEAQVAAVVDAHDPEALELPDGQELPADGATSRLVRWRRRGAAGTQVPYDVNGATGTATASADGTVELAVTAATPGPVRVTIGTLELELTAQEV